MQQHPLLSNDVDTDIFGSSEFANNFSIYSCTSCSQPLIIIKGQLREGQVEDIIKGCCPQCDSHLVQSLSCKLVRAPFDTPLWKHPKINFKQYSESVPRPRFTSAASLFGLSSQIDFVDALLGGLKENTIVFIKGSKLPLIIAERYCVRTQLPEHRGGMDSRALFIDGGNSFDLYLFTSIAREYRLDYKRALNRFIISRAFTPYELLQLVEKDVRESFEIYNPQLFVISDIFHLFKQDVEEYESRSIVQKIGYLLRKYSQTKRVPIVITCTSRADYLEYLFREYCNVEAEFIEGERQITSKLIKHPTKQPTEIIQEFSERAYNQKLLVPLRTMQHG